MFRFYFKIYTASTEKLATYFWHPPLLRGATKKTLQTHFREFHTLYYIRLSKTPWLPSLSALNSLAGCKAKGGRGLFFKYFILHWWNHHLLLRSNCHLDPVLWISTVFLRVCPSFKLPVLLYKRREKFNFFRKVSLVFSGDFEHIKSTRTLLAVFLHE